MVHFLKYIIDKTQNKEIKVRKSNRQSILKFKIQNRGIVIQLFFVSLPSWKKLKQQTAMDYEEPPPSPSIPSIRSSSLLKDISNFTTPRRPPFSLTTAPSPATQFFTASKHAPTSSSFHRRPKKASTATAAKKFKAFQLDQSQSSRKAQIKKERSLKSLAKSLSVWLNFLLQNPNSCGCHYSAADASAPTTNGKRDGAPVISVVGVDSAWRTPKRQRKSMSSKENAGSVAEVPDSSFSHLRDSLKDVCSFDDLNQRMSLYFSLAACKEIFLQMNRVAKVRFFFYKLPGAHKICIHLVFSY